MVLGCIVHPVAAQPASIPVTRIVLEDPPTLSIQEDTNFSLTSFIVSLYNSNKNALRGIYVKNTLQFPIVQQPSNNAGFVSTMADTVTQFASAANFGSIGLLAHNNLAGSDFSQIEEDDVIYLVYGDGRLEPYEVTAIKQFQALSPYSPYSSFVDLADSNRTLTYEDLFYETYGVSGNLVMQTCIENEGIDSWGRLFIIAQKTEL